MHQLSQNLKLNLSPASKSKSLPLYFFWSAFKLKHTVRWAFRIQTSEQTHGDTWRTLRHRCSTTYETETRGDISQALPTYISIIHSRPIWVTFAPRHCQIVWVEHPTPSFREFHLYFITRPTSFTVSAQNPTSFIPKLDFRVRQELAKRIKNNSNEISHGEEGTEWTKEEGGQKRPPWTCRGASTPLHFSHKRNYPEFDPQLDYRKWVANTDRPSMRNPTRPTR